MKKKGGGKAMGLEEMTIGGEVSKFAGGINTMGSEKRMSLALGIGSVDEVAHQMQAILKAKPPNSLQEGWGLLRQGIDLLHARPRKVGSGPCKEVIHRVADSEFSLVDLPLLRCWPNADGLFMTLPNVYTEDPDNGQRN